MKYLLDTDAFSDIARGVVGVKARFSAVGQTLIRISSVSVEEIEFGRQRNPERVTRRGAVIDALLASIEALVFDVEDAYASARIRAVLARAGRPIGPKDVMIAGTALARGLIVVTANTREFSRVPGLQIENWRTPQLQPAPTEVHETPCEYRVLNRARGRVILGAPP
jgi:tRNA(fMet)-specific endonuclease VapC